MSGDIFGCPSWGGGRGATNTQWLEARGAAMDPTIHTTHSYLTPNVGGAGVRLRTPDVGDTQSCCPRLPPGKEKGQKTVSLFNFCF